MSLKMMKNTLLVSALVAMGSIAAIGCGDDGDKGNETVDGGGATPGGGMMGGGGDGGGAESCAGKKRTWSGTLVPVLDQNTNNPIKTPHKIVALDNETGQPLEGGKYSAMTSASNGAWEIKDVPMDKPIAFHTAGQGDAMTGFYDAVTINVKCDTAPEPLSRISAAGTATLAEMAAGYTAKPEAAGLSVGVYHVVNGQRLGTIGCVKAVLDDSEEATKAADLRYVPAGGIPSATATMSEKVRGAMLFGNIPKGKHKLKFTVDNGATYFGETEINIFRSRSEAESQFKSILFFLGIEVPEDKTPAGCM